MTGSARNSALAAVIEREGVIEAGVLPRIGPVARGAVGAEITAVGVVGAVTADAIPRGGPERRLGPGSGVAVPAVGLPVSTGERKGGGIVAEAATGESIAALMARPAVAAPGPDMPAQDVSLVIPMTGDAAGVFEPEAPAAMAIAARERSSAGGPLMRGERESKPLVGHSASLEASEARRTPTVLRVAPEASAGSVERPVECGAVFQLRSDVLVAVEAALAHGRPDERRRVTGLAATVEIGMGSNATESRAAIRHRAE